LRERREDIPALAEHFVARSAREMGRPFTGLCPESLDKLQTYPWPGNVRELQNVLERAAILTDGSTVTIADALIAPVPVAQPDKIAISEPEQGPSPVSPRPRRLDDAERQHIEQVLEESGWTIEGPGGAAAALGIAPSTLRSRMKKLGIRRS
jgi:DNA-binding NtrC family response regulator